MKLIVFGLSLSSSWGNGHATTYRGLLKGFAERGHEVVFYERDVPWYAAHRDLTDPDYCELRLYGSLDELGAARAEIAAADAVILGSYVPEGVALARHLRAWRDGPLAFYDIDTPVTVAKLEAGDEEYLSRRDVPLFDLYLSFSGGPVMDRLADEFGARAVAFLGCNADTEFYRPLKVPKRYELGYLGTYAESRQAALEKLLIEPARRLPDRRFVVAGPQYPGGIDWPDNVERIDHLPPPDHPEFYASLRFALNVTRSDMVAAGFSPSVRVFEAAACATPVITDAWAGLDTYFAPGSEILVAHGPDDVASHLAHSDDEARAVGAAGRERVVAEHSARGRAAALETELQALAMRDRPRRLAG